VRKDASVIISAEHETLVRQGLADVTAGRYRTLGASNLVPEDPDDPMAALRAARRTSWCVTSTWESGWHMLPVEVRNVVLDVMAGALRQPLHPGLEVTSLGIGAASAVTVLPSVRVAFERHDADEVFWLALLA
jgi:hypothetical protein